MNYEKELHEKELDEMFDNTYSGKLTKALKRARLRSIIRTILISTLTIAILYIFSSYVGTKLLDSRQSSLQIIRDRFNYISAPNEYIGESIRYRQGLFQGKTVYSTYKVMGDKIVYTGEKEYSYGLFTSDNIYAADSPIIFGTYFSEDNLKQHKYDKFGNREMVFFYPFVKYLEYKNDLSLLESIGENKYIEMALSFDKAYNIEQVNKIIPENITLAWYWIDDLTEDEKQNHQAHIKKETTPEGRIQEIRTPARVRSAKKAYGIKAYDELGLPINNPDKLFILNLINGYSDTDSLKGNTSREVAYKAEFKRLFNTISGTDDHLTKEDIRILGIIATGDAESMKALRTLPFIKASSLGVVTDKY